jgi:phage terminase large subunit
MTTVISGTDRWLADETRRAFVGDSASNSGTESKPHSARTQARSSIGRAGESSIRRVKLRYEPFAKQQEFHASPAKYRLFGGAAGPGKSKALLMEAILQAHETPGANTLLLRRTFPELEQSLLLYFRRDVPRELYKSFNESKHVVEWLNQSTTRFGYCQNESDVYQYQGAEFLFIGIDELTLFTLRQWQFLTSRNRCAVPGSFPCMAGATNPGNIGHAWVKALWIDRQAASGMENPDAYDPADYDFIPARVSDNPIYAGDEQYLKTLRALPTHLRRAFLDGDWDVFAGQYFDKFDYSRHVVRAEQIQWKPWWPRWISIDWGFEHPSAAFWHAAAPLVDGGLSLTRNADSTSCSESEAHLTSALESGSKLPHSTLGRSSSRVVTYREYVTHRTAPRELARQIIERSVVSAPDFARDDSAAETNADRERIDAIYLSPDAFARRTDEASIADQMGDVFVAAGFPRPVPADNDRVGGWMLMYQMLEAGEWLLADNCVELIRTLPNLVRDPARIEDIEKMDGDDAADAARYGLKSRYGTRYGNGSERRVPLAVRLAERVTSADPTVRAIQARKAQIEESRRSQPVSFLHRRR